MDGFIARFAGRCAVCGGDISTGERIDYTRNVGERRKTRHADCKEHAAQDAKLAPNVAEQVTRELTAYLL